MAELIRRGVPSDLTANSWQKAKDWPAHPEGLEGAGDRPEDDDYAKAVQCAKVCARACFPKATAICTRRGAWKCRPLGTVFCAERTPEHQYLYCEGEEAVFWSTRRSVPTPA